MADVSIIDIGGTQWEIKDRKARNDITNLKLECDKKANKSEIPTTVEQLTDSNTYAKKTDIPDVTGLEQSIANLNNSLTVEKSFITANASDNTILTNALLVDLYSYKGDSNKPRIVIDRITLENLPPDCAWGIREVFVVGFDKTVNESFLVVKITGCDKTGLAALWLNTYNNNNWTGWLKK